LRSLAQSLESKGSRLILRRGPSAATLQRLASETSADTIVYSRLYEPSALDRDRRVAAALGKRDLTVQDHPGNVLFEPGAVLGSAGNPFQVFTAFWNACRRAAEPPKPRPAPVHLAAPDSWPQSLPLDELQLEPVIDWAGGLREAWQPGEPRIHFDAGQ